MLSTVSNQYTTSQYQNLINRSSRTSAINTNFMEAVSQTENNSAPASTAIPANNTSGSVPHYTLYKDAVLSTCSASGASVHVYNDEANGLYKVKGTDVNGKEFETLIDIKDIDPNNASRIEMLTLAAHLGKRDDKFPVNFLVSSRREMDTYALLSPNEKNNFKWKSVFTKENQYDDLSYIAQTFHKAGAMDGYVTVNKLIQDVKYQVKNFSS